jgi:hypothetical protein
MIISAVNQTNGEISDEDLLAVNRTMYFLTPMSRPPPPMVAPICFQSNWRL